MKSITTDLATSFTALFRGIGYFLRNRWTWKYVAIVIFINIIAFVLTIWLLFFIFGSVIDWTFGLFSIDPQGVTSIVVSIIAGILAVLAVILVFTSISSILNAPIYSLLTEALLKRESQYILDSYPHRGLLGEIYYAIGLEINKYVVIVWIFIATLLFNVLPVVGQILFVIATILQLIIITGIDLFEPLIAKFRLRFWDKVKFILSRPFRYWPFLIVAGFLSSIPIINIITIPLSIISAITTFKEDFYGNGK